MFRRCAISPNTSSLGWVRSPAFKQLHQKLQERILACAEWNKDEESQQEPQPNWPKGSKVAAPVGEDDLPY